MHDSAYNSNLTLSQIQPLPESEELVPPIPSEQIHDTEVPKPSTQLPSFRQVFGVQNGRSVLQLLSEKPTAQLQLVSGPNPSMQVPPFRQVVGVQ